MRDKGIGSDNSGRARTVVHERRAALRQREERKCIVCGQRIAKHAERITVSIAGEYQRGFDGAGLAPFMSNEPICLRCAAVIRVAVCDAIQNEAQEAHDLLSEKFGPDYAPDGQSFGQNDEIRNCVRVIEALSDPGDGPLLCTVCGKRDADAVADPGQPCSKCSIGVMLRSEDVLQC